MTKEPKKSDSSDATEHTLNENPNNSTISSIPQTLEHKNSDSQKMNFFYELGSELRASIFNTNGYLRLDFFTLFWLFVGGSFIGLILETAFHAIVYGGLESRAGLVWGPFSPIYGVGAVVLTAFLNRYYHSHNLIIFLVAMIVGSIIEYSASWGMEVFWGAIAWDYTGTFGSIQGRTNFFFGMLWGMLGLVWVRIILPFVKRVFSLVDAKNKIIKIATMLMVAFMAIDIACTCMALVRAKERALDIPATNPIQVFYDETFPDSFINARFENMTVSGTDAAPGGNSSEEHVGLFL